MAGKHSRYSDIVKAFGRAVRQFRVKIGCSQESLADRASLDRSYMSQIERGIKNATLNSIWRISSALDILPSALMAMTEQIAGIESKSTQLHYLPENQPQPGPTLTTSKPRGGRVLVVDDDAEICGAVGTILQDAGFDTSLALNGMDAMKTLATVPISAVVSDIRMANGNGFELLEALRRNYPDVPLFFITGYDDMSVEDAVQRGARGLFNKPFDLASFVSSVKSSIDTELS